MLDNDRSNPKPTAPAPRRTWLRRATSKVSLVMIAAVAASAAMVGLTVAPAAAVSGISGLDPFSTGCSSNGTQYTSPASAVYDGARFVGNGYLRYSYGCQANWSEFHYANASAYNDYSVKPWAWEDATSGTDQGSPNLWLDPVYSKMVDGRNRACAGAHIHRYPSNQWVKWQVFGCA